MNVGTIILFVALASAGLMLLFWSFRNWRQRRKERIAVDAERPYIEWAMAVTGAKTDEEILSQDPMWADGGDKVVSNRRFHDRARKLYAAAQRRDMSRKLAEELKSADDARLAFGIIDADSPDIDSEIEIGVAEQDVPGLFLAHLQDMLAKALSGSRESLEHYIHVVDAERTQAFCEKHGLNRPDFPENWDDLVTSLIPAPDVKHFRNVGKKSPGEVALIADEARQNGDLKVAKLVLAYCRQSKGCSYPYKVAVGELAYDELVRLVNSTENVTTYVTVDAVR